MYSFQSDDNINIIRKVVGRESPGSEIILFGSRASGAADDSSDYDLLVKINGRLSITEKRSLASRIRKSLALEFIDSDVIVRDETEILTYDERPGSVIRDAVRKGIRL